MTPSTQVKANQQFALTTLPPINGRITEGGRRLNGHLPKSSNSAPLVSVITVVFNRASTIGECIESVRSQSYKPIEYIVIDGASVDGTVDTIKQFSSDIDYYVSEPDGGIYDAMNKGISVATGDYVLLLNSDDWYRPDAVEKLVECALASNADIVHADAMVVDQSGRKIRKIIGSAHAGMLTSVCQIRHETMLVKREIYQRLGVYEDSYEIIADYEFAIRLYRAGCHFEHVPDALLFFRNTGISNQNDSLRKQERVRLFTTLFPFLEPAALELLANGRIANQQLLELMDRYKFHSEEFTRSLAFSIASSPSFRIAEVLAGGYRRLFKDSRAEPYLSSLKQWVYSKLPGNLR